MTDLIKGEIKLIVTHKNPDVDAIGAVWLFRRFGGSDFEQARTEFVYAGEEMDGARMGELGVKPEEVVHVDTGMGPFDHHQPDNTKRDSATLRVHEYLQKTKPSLKKDVALTRVVNFINDTDHFASFWWPEPADDRYLFMLEEILAGLRSGKHFNDYELVDFGMICLDGVYTGMKIRVRAEEDLETKGWEFESPWGPAYAIENKNDEVMKLAQKRGYDVVVRKDAEEGHVRIKAAPEKSIDLTKVYERILELDHEGTWFLHPSKAMLLNGSKKAAGKSPTPLSLKKVVELVKSG